ncbi:MAG: hypothetical protein ACRDFQ_05615 [Anaerolineales bacterium]
MPAPQYNCGASRDALRLLPKEARGVNHAAFHVHGSAVMRAQKDRLLRSGFGWVSHGYLFET